MDEKLVFFQLQKRKQKEAENCFSSAGGRAADGLKPILIQTRACAILVQGSVNSPVPPVSFVLLPALTERVHGAVSPSLLSWDLLPCLNSAPSWSVMRRRSDGRCFPVAPFPSPRQAPVTKAENFQLVAVFRLSFYTERHVT